MFFVISKLVWLVLQPSHFIFLDIAATFILLTAGYWRGGCYAGASAAIMFILFGMLPTNHLILEPLERRFPAPAWPEHVDGIVALNGGVRDFIQIRDGKKKPDLAYLLAISTVARRYPEARIILSGGSGEVNGSGSSEAEVGELFSDKLGLNRGRLVLETKSRNTWESLAFSERIAQPRQGQVWLLATAAFQMPRAVEVAYKLNWNIVPLPTSYLTACCRGRGLNISENLALTDIGLHEWIGLIVYRISGLAQSHPK